MDAAQKKHQHEWVPNDEGHYDCADLTCGAVKGMSIADAKALWGDPRSAATAPTVPPAKELQP